MWKGEERAEGAEGGEREEGEKGVFAAEEEPAALAERLEAEEEVGLADGEVEYRKV